MTSDKFGSPNSFGKFKFGFIALTLTSLFEIIQSVSAQDSNVTSTGNDTGIILGIEAITFLLFAVIIYQNWISHKQIGNSIISLPFIYMFVGMALTIASRLFLVLYQLDVYQVKPMVISIYWHFFIYLSMISFLLAINKVADRTKDKELKPFSLSDLMIIGIMILVSLFIFLTPETVGKSIMMMVMDTFIPEIGLLHFLAFGFALGVTLRMFSVLQKTRKTPVGKYMQSISIPFFVFLILSTLTHLLSLITDSWDLIDLGGVDLVDQILWVLSFGIVTYGYFILNKEISTTTKSLGHDKDTIEVKDNQISETVMGILTNHVGSLAENIFYVSSKESGIDGANLNKTNIVEFANAVESNTTDLIGHFPSRYLKVSIQKAVTA